MQDSAFYIQKVNNLLAKRNIYQEGLDKTTKEKLRLEQRTIAIEEAQIFLQTVAKATQEKIRFRLEDIVNLALSSVFGPRYRFEIKFEIKNGRTEASLILWDGENELDPYDSNGGGLADILAFSLRIALLIISKNRRLLILDEPMKFVSADLMEAAYSLMQKLSHELKIQIICVTHEEELISKADTVYKIRQKGGISWAQSLISSTNVPVGEKIGT
jgi:DNA repair exonuclease SbcCD ATPase subunit